VKKIKCSNPSCNGIIAHVLADNIIDVYRTRGKTRVGNRAVVTGSGFTIMANCQGWDDKTKAPCAEQTTITIKEGKLVEDGLVFAEESKDGPTATPDAGEDPDDQPGDTSASTEDRENDPQEEGQRGLPERRFTKRREPAKA
jgi:hypothetical protein